MVYEKRDVPGERGRADEHDGRGAAVLGERKHFDGGGGEQGGVELQGDDRDRKGGRASEDNFFDALPAGVQRGDGIGVEATVGAAADDPGVQ